MLCGWSLPDTTCLNIRGFHSVKNSTFNRHHITTAIYRSVSYLLTYLLMPASHAQETCTWILSKLSSARNMHDKFYASSYYSSQYLKQVKWLRIAHKRLLLNKVYWETNFIINNKFSAFVVCNTAVLSSMEADIYLSRRLRSVATDVVRWSWVLHHLHVLSHVHEDRS